MIQTHFDRIEDKYILDNSQYKKIESVISQFGHVDEYGKYEISSLYYDDNSFSLAIRSSCDKLNNIKLRARKYSHNMYNEFDSVMFERKERINGRIIKTRATMPFVSVCSLSSAKSSPKPDNKTALEIFNFMVENELNPEILVKYMRQAYIFPENTDLRLTIDTNITACKYNSPNPKISESSSLIPQDKYLMEIKYYETVPMWLISALEENGIHKVDFSKYVSAYKTLFF